MPGLLENTLHQGYVYADPYVEKVRNAVPLIDRVAKKAEEIVPPLITRADELAEPRIEKMRPYVEPRIEQVKEVVTPRIEQVKECVCPYVDEGVKNYEAVKEFTDAKATQIKDFKEEKVTQIKGFTEAKVTQIREFTEPQVEKIKGFTEAKVTQIREFTDPQVEKIKVAVEPRIERVSAVIKARKQKAQKLLRVPGSFDLKGLKAEGASLLGKIAVWLEKAEAVIDKYLPLTDEQKQDYTSSGSDASFTSAVDSACSVESDSSTIRINRSLVSIKSRLLFAFTIQVQLLLTFPLLVKEAIMDGTAKEKACIFTNQVKEKVTEKADVAVKTIGAKSQKLSQTSFFKKGMKLAVDCSEKMLGKEKSADYLSKIQARIPAAFKVEEPAVDGTSATSLRKRNVA
jgi:hypothetical protein